MCEVSDKLKICSCTVRNVEKLDNYWILSRFIKGKEEYILGEMVMPNAFDQQIDLRNQAVLNEIINQSETFDVNIQPKPKDWLVLYFNTISKPHDNMVYAFVYKKGKWMATDYCPFELMNHYEDIKKGKIENAVK